MSAWSLAHLENDAGILVVTIKKPGGFHLSVPSEQSSHYFGIVFLWRKERKKQQLSALETLDVAKTEPFKKGMIFKLLILMSCLLCF